MSEVTIRRPFSELDLGDQLRSKPIGFAGSSSVYKRFVSRRRAAFTSKNRGPQLNSKSRRVTPSISQRRGFGADTDFLRMQSKSFRLHRTERANNHIKQGDTVFFTRNPIGATYNQLPAMFTRTFHNSPLQKTTFTWQPGSLSLDLCTCA